MNGDKKIPKQILNYLKKRPEAADTLEGITDWWIKLERVEQTVDRIAESLEILIKNGLIDRVRSKNGTTIYRLSKQK